MIYAHWLAVRCSVQHRRPMFSRTAPTVRLYLYHNRYVLSFLSFGPSSGRGEIPDNTAVPGCSDADAVRPSGPVLHDGSGGGRSVGCALPPMAGSSSSEVLALDRRVESGLEWAGVGLDEPTTGERLRNLQESDVSLQQRLQVSRAAHGLVFRNLRNDEYRVQ